MLSKLLFNKSIYYVISFDCFFFLKNNFTLIVKADS